MKRRKPEPPPVYVGSHLDKLSKIPRHRHDPDEQPSREDRAPLTSQLFESPVPLPRFLRPRKKR